MSRMYGRINQQLHSGDHISQKFSLIIFGFISENVNNTHTIRIHLLNVYIQYKINNI